MQTKDRLRKKYFFIRKKKYFDINPSFFNPLIKLIKKRYKKKEVNLSSYYNIPVLKARITFEVYNLFDALNEYGVNSQTGRAYSAILSDSDIASFKNNYTTIQDTYQDPSQYGAPRSIKIGLEVKY